MKLNENVFSFEDFLAGKVGSPNKSESLVDVVESINVDDKDELVYLEDDIKLPNPPEGEYDVENEDEDEVVSNEITENFYPLFKDKSENFSCDIYVEGAKTDETITRLIIESEDWTLMFQGEIKNGKINIPIKKLSLFEEGQVGKIKLEVIAEGTLFVPFEQDFKVKVSKKVSVSLNENRNSNKVSKKSKVDVKVNVNR